MEDVLTLDEQPSDPNHPVVCFDERPCQLLEHVLVPMPMKPGKPEREVGRVASLWRLNPIQDAGFSKSENSEPKWTMPIL
jgi:hypothetical protein